MATQIATFLKKPYPLYISFDKTFSVFLGLSIFVPLFLIAFKPFGMEEAQVPVLKIIGFGPLVLFTLSFNFYLLPQLLPNLFHQQGWNIKKQVAWFFYICFSATLIGTIYTQVTHSVFDIRCELTFAQHFMDIFLVSFLVTAIGFAVGHLLHQYFEIKKLRQAEYSERNLIKEGKVTLISENGKETLVLNPQKILFIESCDNYSKVVWIDENETRERLIRSSLKNLQKQIISPFLVRCHRSFIVNTNHILSFDGNARGYKLLLENFKGFVPVSRQAGRELIPKLRTAVA